MQNKVFNAGPIDLTTTTTTNLLNPPTATGGVNGGSSPQYIIVKHVRVINRLGTAQTFSMWKGATGGNVAGTEVFGSGQSVAANSSYDWYGIQRIESTHFIVGGANANNALSVTFEGEIGVAG